MPGTRGVCTARSPGNPEATPAHDKDAIRLQLVGALEAIRPELSPTEIVRVLVGGDRSQELLRLVPNPVDLLRHVREVREMLKAGPPGQDWQTVQTLAPVVRQSTQWGYVKLFFANRAFGFVVSEACTSDIFLHRRNLSAADAAKLVPGVPVEFKLVESSRCRGKLEGVSATLLAHDDPRVRARPYWAQGVQEKQAKKPSLINVQWNKRQQLRQNLHLAIRAVLPDACTCW